MDTTYNELQDLIEKTMTNGESCTTDGFLSGDDHLPVCFGLDDDKWEEHFMADLHRQS